MPYHVVRWLYTGLYAALAPLVLALTARRADSRRRLMEYFAGPPQRAPGPLSERMGSPRVWLHAVSVGEALSALPVLAELRRGWPDMEVHLTSTIEDAVVVALRSGEPFASARFLPMDLPPLMERLCDVLRPQLVLISETDFWPNMLHALSRRGVPAFLVNGRISYKIEALYARLGGFSRRMFGSLAHAFVQTEMDAERLRKLEVGRGSVTVAGNTKYEASLRPFVPGEHEERLRALLADPRARLVAGSTHAGEETLALRVDAPLAVLAPRDIRRSAEVRALAPGSVAFSDLTPEALAGARVVVVDVLGVLPRLYDGAAAAFIGGSFDGSGGHNFLEAARFGVPVVCGPKMRNFVDDVAEFARHTAIEQGAGEAEVVSRLQALLADPARARRVGEAGAELLRAHRGAAARTADAIRAQVRV